MKPFQKRESIAISVVVVAKEAGNVIQHLFSSLSDQGRKPDEVLLIIDRLDDNTLKVVGFPNSVRVVLSEEGGLGAARNKGLIKAEGDYVVFIDADSCADSGLLKSIEKFFLENPNVVAQAGPIVNVRSFEEIDKIKSRLQLLRKKWRKVDSVIFWPTNNFSVKRDVALSVGGFKKDIHYAGEDMLFCNELKKACHKIAFNPEALLYHMYYGHRGGMLRRQIRSVKGNAEIMIRTKSSRILFTPLTHIGLIFLSLLGMVILANPMYGIFALLSVFHRFYRAYVDAKEPTNYMPLTITLLEKIPLVYVSYFMFILWAPILWLKTHARNEIKKGRFRCWPCLRKSQNP